MSLRDTAKELTKTADKLAQLCSKYLADAAASAAQSGRDNTGGGMSQRQLRQRLQNEIISRLCPKPIFGQPDPPLQFDGAPEARRFIAARGPLPGL
jgi:hypothetical protein